jgi:hypothetical protein
LNPKCPKDGEEMADYVSFLAPVYQTFMCEKCGSLFYDLKDEKKLKAIIDNAQQVMAASILERSLENR